MISSAKHNLGVRNIFIFMNFFWSGHSLCLRFFSALPNYLNFAKSRRRPFEQSLSLFCSPAVPENKKGKREIWRPPSDLSWRYDGGGRGFGELSNKNDDNNNKHRPTWTAADPRSKGAASQRGDRWIKQDFFTRWSDKKFFLRVWHNSYVFHYIVPFSYFAIKWKMTYTIYRY